MVSLRTKARKMVRTRGTWMKIWMRMRGMIYMTRTRTYSVEVASRVFYLTV